MHRTSLVLYMISIIVSNILVEVQFVGIGTCGFSLYGTSNNFVSVISFEVLRYVLLRTFVNSNTHLEWNESFKAIIHIYIYQTGIC